MADDGTPGPQAAEQQQPLPPPPAAATRAGGASEPSTELVAASAASSSDLPEGGAVPMPDQGLLLPAATPEPEPECAEPAREAVPTLPHGSGGGGGGGGESFLRVHWVAVPQAWRARRVNRWRWRRRRRQPSAEVWPATRAAAAAPALPPAARTAPPLVPAAAEQQSLDGGPGIRGQGVAGALVWVIEPAAAAVPLCV
jgi:hypothetical protein